MHSLEQSCVGGKLRDNGGNVPRVKPLRAFFQRGEIAPAERDADLCGDALAPLHDATVVAQNGPDAVPLTDPAPAATGPAGSERKPNGPVDAAGNPSAGYAHPFVPDGQRPVNPSPALSLSPLPNSAKPTHVEPVRHPTVKLPPDAEERWRTALYHYLPLVTHDRMRRLNGAAVHFANLIVGMHNRIHPIFTDTFLASLADLPASDPMNEATLFTTLEIVLSGETGRILRLGVLKSSGLTAFDVAALESTTRAQPFGPPPPETLSDDRNVYLHWQFHRDVEACGTANVHPFLLEFKPDANSPSSSDHGSRPISTP